MKIVFTAIVLSASLLLQACGGGGGGGGSGDGGSVPVAGTFPIRSAVERIVTSGFSASGLSTRPYTLGSFTLTKAPAVSTSVLGTTVLAQVTTTTWSGGGYPAPYALYYDSNYDLVGLQIDGVYGKRTGGASLPATGVEGATGVVGQYTIYSDAGLTNAVGAGTLVYRVEICCDTYRKERGDLILTLTFTAGGVTKILRQKYVVSITGGTNFGSEAYNDGTTEKELYYPFGGY